ncbi:hypothetical protein [Aestuariivirga sp.]|uniref:hypothetical protein n=1 Tax=Aestuariivirga sp. TaxID=2650926 RepID=UPI0035936331
MNLSRKLKIAVIVAVAGLGSLYAADRVSGVGSLSVVSSAEARVGRPLTPVSVAGATRRTVRRCAAGVYNC